MNDKRLLTDQQIIQGLESNSLATALPEVSLLQKNTCVDFLLDLLFKTPILNQEPNLIPQFFTLVY